MHGRAVLRKKTNLHGDALCFLVKTWTKHRITEALLNNGLAVWQRLVVGGWRLVAVGVGRRLAGAVLGAVLQKNIVLKDSPDAGWTGEGRGWGTAEAHVEGHTSSRTKYVTLCMLMT